MEAKKVLNELIDRLSNLTKPKQEWLDEVRILKQSILKEYKSY